MCENCDPIDNFSFVETKRGNYCVLTVPREYLEVLDMGEMKPDFSFLTTIIPVGVVRPERLSDLIDLIRAGLIPPGCSAQSVKSRDKVEAEMNHGLLCLSASANNFEWQTREQQVEYIYQQ